MVEFKKLPNHIKEYLASNLSHSEFIELFEAENDDVDIKSEFSFEELILVNVLQAEDNYCLNHNIPSPYSKFLEQYMRLKISKDRASRKEFVDVNKRERFDQNLEKFNSFKNLQDVKK